MRVVANFLRRPRFANGSVFRSDHLWSGYLRKGLRCLVYLDDILVLAPAPCAHRYAKVFAEIIACFGLSLHPTKSDLTPRPRRQHLGLVVDTAARKFAVPHQKFSNLVTSATALA